MPDARSGSRGGLLTWRRRCAGAGGWSDLCLGQKDLYQDAGWRTLEVEVALRRARGQLESEIPSTSDVDLGPLISESARDRFQATLNAAVAAGARVSAGGSPLPGPGWFFEPTVLYATTPEAEGSLAGVFGPSVVVRGVSDVEAAVEAARASPYALAASVWSADRRAARRVASRLDAGMVTINEAVTPTMHASAPFGGVKASGFGRTHGPSGLHEFVQSQAIYARRPGGFRPELFPYGAKTVENALRIYRRLFHGG